MNTLDPSSIDTLVSGVVGIILLFLGNEMAIMTVEASRTHIDTSLSETKFGVSERLVDLFSSNRRRWYTLWLSLLAIGGVLFMLVVYEGFQIALLKYPETAVGYLILLIVIPIGLVYFAVGKHRELSGIEVGPRLNNEVVLDDDNAKIEYPSSLVRSVRLYMIAVIILCSFVMLLMVFMPALCLAYSLLIGFLVPVIICVGGGYLLIISQNASEQSTSVSNNDVELD
ncbi:MAG: hypothetical protein EAX95_16480 [Candidatus Thorarchaeota archaeon]|nr:hypothetical protein [Candidatus Thorarchaeota archaeon]